MARERQDLNLFYGNCDLDLGNIQAWGKNSDRFRGNSNTKEETRCAGREGKNREARRQRMETERLIDLVVTLRLTNIFESVFFLVPLDQLAVIQSGSPF